MASKMIWSLHFKGGFMDACSASVDTEHPDALIFCWPCPGDCGDPRCTAHMSFSVDGSPMNALAYRRDEICEHRAVAIYALGDTEPAGEERDLVSVGAPDEIPDWMS